MRPTRAWHSGAPGLVHHELSHGDDSSNSFGARADLTVGGRSYEIFRLDALPAPAGLPYSLKVLLENMLRHEDGITVNPGGHRGPGRLGRRRRARARRSPSPRPAS